MSNHHRNLGQGISESNSVIFVGIPRTGSQAFASMLGAGGPHKINSGNFTLEDFCLMHGIEKVKSFKRVASVRNPYDRIYSCWTYASKPAGVSFREFIGLLKSNSDRIKSLDNLRSISSLDLINDNFPFGTRPFHGLASMHNFIKHPEIDIDLIVSIDDMDRSINDIRALLKKDIAPLHINKSNKPSDYSSMKRDPEFISIVNEIYGKDFAKFGYKML
jgi:hypothetical protein